VGPIEKLSSFRVPTKIQTICQCRRRLNANGVLEKQNSHSLYEWLVQYKPNATTKSFPTRRKRLQLLLTPPATGDQPEPAPPTRVAIKLETKQVLRNHANYGKPAPMSVPPPPIPAISKQDKVAAMTQQSTSDLTALASLETSSDEQLLDEYKKKVEAIQRRIGRH
jgi:hypothetical protein